MIDTDDRPCKNVSTLFCFRSLIRGGRRYEVMTMRRLVVLFAAVATTAWAASHEKPTFHIEPQNRFTFSHDGTLVTGDKVQLTFTKLASNDHFLINRCGVPCNTSKVVFQVDGAHAGVAQQTFDVQENGVYYFWIQRVLDGGETGPSFIDKFNALGTHFDAVFTTGSTVSGDFEHHKP
jgi:hypothetical protein